MNSIEQLVKPIATSVTNNRRMMVLIHWRMMEVIPSFISALP